MAFGRFARLFVTGGIALALTGYLAVGLHRLRGDQRAVLGESGQRDLIGYVGDLERHVEALESRVTQIDSAAAATGRRLEGAITHSAVVRYDAYGEMTPLDIYTGDDGPDEDDEDTDSLDDHDDEDGDGTRLYAGLDEDLDFDDDEDTDGDESDESDEAGESDDSAGVAGGTDDAGGRGSRG